MSVTSRDDQLELLRGVAIAVVVGIHTTAFHLRFAALDGAGGRIIALVHLLAGFGVPLFFGLSALGLALRHDVPMSLAEYVPFLRRRASRLLPAYFAWSLISVAMLQPGMLHDPRGLFWLLVNGDADEQFYFVPLVFAVYLLWPALRFAALAARRSDVVALALAGSGMALSMLWWRVGSWNVLPALTVATLPMWSLYLGLGIAAATRLDRLRAFLARPVVLWAMGAVTTVFALATYRNFIALVEPDYQPGSIWLASTIMQWRPTLYILSAMILVFGAVTRIAPRGGGWIRRLSEHSYGIYLVHFLVIRYLVHSVLPPELVHGGSVVHNLGDIVISWGLALGASAAIVIAGARVAILRPYVSNHW
jgi:peptidoglycan/LPS O-acetylase OafA/YrhL